MHDGEGGVTAATVAIVLTDIPPGSGDGGVEIVVQQQFSVDFRLDDTAAEAVTRTQDLGNLVERARSGNPGYITGLPVLAGALESLGAQSNEKASLTLREIGRSRSSSLTRTTFGEEALGGSFS